MRRREARDGIIPFTEYTFPRYRTAGFHRAVAAQLERVERGEVDRLMLLLPPRHGKSELASRRFPAFVLGRQPQKEFISVSASSDLATDFGRDVRNIINGQEYKRLFPTALAEDSQAKNKWRTEAGGGYYAVGVGGQFMGRGADILMIDDPFASMADAQSETTRKAVWDWYTGTAYNRLQPGGAIVIINHRMHEDDLSGRLIAQAASGGDRFEIVEMPAINDNGMALWPESYPIEALGRIRSNSIPRYFSALYQQNPTPDDGSYFLRDWLRPYTKAPDRATLRIYGASDYAVTQDGGDWTVHIVIGVDPIGRMYLLDLWRKQTTADKWIEAFCDLVEEWKPLEWAEETGQIKASLGPFIARRQREREAYVYRRQFPTRGDKAVRAQSIRGRMALEGLYVPVGEPWYPAFEAEVLSFPAAKHDDQVDTLGLIGQLLAQIQHGDELDPPPREHRSLADVRLDDLWDDMPRRSGGGRI